MDLTSANFLYFNDFKRVLGIDGKRAGLKNDDLKILEAYCESDSKHPGHLFYPEVCKSINYLMIHDRYIYNDGGETIC